MNKLIHRFSEIPDGRLSVAEMAKTVGLSESWFATTAANLFIKLEKTLALHAASMSSGSCRWLRLTLRGCGKSPRSVQRSQLSGRYLC